jgi:hypothetical protein
MTVNDEWKIRILMELTMMSLKVVPLPPTFCHDTIRITAANVARVGTLSWDLLHIGVNKCLLNSPLRQKL